MMSWPDVKLIPQTNKDSYVVIIYTINNVQALVPSCIIYHNIVSYVFCIENCIVYLHIHLHNDRKTMYLRDVNKNV